MAVVNQLVEKFVCGNSKCNKGSGIKLYSSFYEGSQNTITSAYDELFRCLHIELESVFITIYQCVNLERGKRISFERKYFFNSC
jgi:hypothetical protein